MPAIKSLTRIGNRWVDVASNSAGEYEEGVRNPRKSWAKETAAAEDNYNKGVQAAIQRKAFGKGVVKAGDQKWAEGAVNKGVLRWPEGIRIAKPAYEAGFAPYHSVIANTVLPPRGPKGDPKNINRVAVMAKALHDEKIRQQS